MIERWKEKLIKGFQECLLKSAVQKQRIELMAEDADFMPYSWHRGLERLWFDVVDSIDHGIKTIRELRGFVSEKK